MTTAPLEEATILVELFDADTGRKVDETSGKNYITPEGLSLARWSTRQTFTGGISLNNTDPTRAPSFSTLWLSDSSAPIDPSSSEGEGVIIGWASGSYSGPHIYRGSFNPSESQATPEFARWVFDWPSHAGVGTIRSVGWGQAAAINAGVDYPPAFPLVDDPQFPLSSTTPIPPSHQGFVDTDGLIYLPNSTAVGHKWDPYSVTQVSTWGPTPAQIGGLTSVTAATRDDTHMYVTGNASVVRKFPLPTGEGPVTAVDVTIPGAPPTLSGVTYDGSMLWVLDATNRKAIRVNKSTGAIEREIPVSSFTTTPSKLTYDPLRGTLLIGGSVEGANTTIYLEYDLDGNVQRRLAGSHFLTHSMIRLPDGRWFHYSAATSGTNRSYGIGLSYVGSRVLLPSAVTKSSLQTMKVTYIFNYV